MKALQTKMYLFILLLTVGACSKDENMLQHPEGLSVDVVQNVELPYVVTSKDEIVFDITISSRTETTIQQAILHLDDTELQTTSATGNEIRLQYTYAVTAEDVGKSLIFLLTVIDVDGQSVERDLTVYVQSAPADIRVTIPTDAPNEIKDDETAEFTIAVVSENDISYIKTFLDGTELTSLTQETFDNPREVDYFFGYQPIIADADKILNFTIEVMDILGNIVQQDYTLSIERSQEADFNFFADVHFGAQFSTEHGPFFNASTGEVYVTSSAAPKSAGIDLISFYSLSTYAYNLVSPTLSSVAQFIYTPAAIGDDAIANWPVRNSTSIKQVTRGSMSRGDFDNVQTAAEIENIYVNASENESNTSAGLANNDVVLFRTAAGLYGILYVKSRSENSASGYLTVDIKIQK